MTPNSVTLAEIENLINSAQIEEHTFWRKELVISYSLPCGFTVTGRAACINPALFDIEIGRKVAREDAIRQLWQLEGYRKQLELHLTTELLNPVLDPGYFARIQELMQNHSSQREV